MDMAESQQSKQTTAPAAASAQSHQDFLAQLTAESKAKQVSFMNDIARKLKRPRVLEKPAASVPRSAGFLECVRMVRGRADRALHRELQECRRPCRAPCHNGGCEAFHSGEG